jgi:flagellar protein FliO/FliZ
MHRAVLGCRNAPGRSALVRWSTVIAVSVCMTAAMSWLTRSVDADEPSNAPAYGQTSPSSAAPRSGAGYVTPASASSSASDAASSSSAPLSGNRWASGEDSSGLNAKTPDRGAADPTEAHLQRLPRRLPARPLETNGTQPNARSGTLSPWTTLFGSLVTLGLIIAGLFCLARWMQRHGPQALRALPPDIVEPLGQRVLARGMAVHLVRCGNRVLVLGSGPDGLRTLTEITDRQEADLLINSCRHRDRGAAGTASFASLWRGSQPTASKPTSEPVVWQTSSEPGELPRVR